MKSASLPCFVGLVSPLLIVSRQGLRFHTADTGARSTSRTSSVSIGHLRAVTCTARPARHGTCLWSAGLIFVYGRHRIESCAPLKFLPSALQLVPVNLYGTKSLPSRCSLDRAVRLAVLLISSATAPCVSRTSQMAARCRPRASPHHIRPVPPQLS